MNKKDDVREWLFGKAVERGEIYGLEFAIVSGPMGSLNGYALFPKRPVIEQGYDGILAYVPVHGGITFAEPTQDGGIVYGFDTAHYDSPNFPINNANWIKEQIAVMIRGVVQASKVEKKYLIAKKPKTRAKFAQQVQDVDVSGEHRWNLGMILNLLSGQI